LGLLLCGTTGAQGGHLLVSDPFRFGHDAIVAETPIPNLSRWLFCSLTKATVSEGGWCRVVRRSGIWKMQTSPMPAAQDCEVICLK
jgi:hypothetical protein